MDQEEGFRAIAAERRALADVLAGLSEEEWATPSLCADWTVRDVAAHTMLGPTTRMRTFVVTMMLKRGDFDEANKVLTARRARLSTDELVTTLRDLAAHRFTPPGFDFHAPLADLLIHRVDMLAPLGLDDAPTPTTPQVWDEVLDFLLSPKAARGFVGTGLPQLEYVATDGPWRSGAGPRVSGPRRAMAMAVAGRSPYLDQLEGPGKDELVVWATR